MMDVHEATTAVDTLIREGRADEAYDLSRLMVFSNPDMSYHPEFLPIWHRSALLSDQDPLIIGELTQQMRDLPGVSALTLCDMERDLGLYCLRNAKRHVGKTRRTWLMCADEHLNAAASLGVASRLAINWSARGRYYMEAGSLHSALDEFSEAHRLFEQGGLDPEHFLTHKLHYAVALGKDWRGSHNRKLALQLSSEVMSETRNPSHKQAAKLVHKLGPVGAMIVWYGWRVKSLLGR